MDYRSRINYENEKLFLLKCHFLGAELFAMKPPVVDPVETQSLAEQVKRLVTAMDLLGKQLNANTTNPLPIPRWLLFKRLRCLEIGCC